MNRVISMMGSVGPAGATGATGPAGPSNLQVKRLTADVPNSTALPVALPDLTLNVVAGQSYAGEMVMLVTSDEGVANDTDLLGGSATFTGQWSEFATNSSGDLTTALPGGGSAAVKVQTYSIYLHCTVSGTVIPRYVSDDPGVANNVAKAGTWFMLANTGN